MERVYRPVTADCVVFDADNRLLVIKRGKEPFKGKYALPGGHIDPGETLEEAARRELLEETGVEIKNLILLGVYSKIGRDPRAETITVAYTGDLPEGAVIQAGDDASHAELVADWEGLDLAFDHNDILQDALRLRGLAK